MTSEALRPVLCAHSFTAGGGRRGRRSGGGGGMRRPRLARCPAFRRRRERAVSRARGGRLAISHPFSRRVAGSRAPGGRRFGSDRPARSWKKPGQIGRRCRAAMPKGPADWPAMRPCLVRRASHPGEEERERSLVPVRGANGARLRETQMRKCAIILPLLQSIEQSAARAFRPLFADAKRPPNPQRSGGRFDCAYGRRGDQLAATSRPRRALAAAIRSTSASASARASLTHFSSTTGVMT